MLSRDRRFRSAVHLLVLLVAAVGCSVPLTAPGGAVLQISASPLSIPAVDGVSTITVVASKADEDGGGPVVDGTQIFFTTPIGVIEERVETRNGFARATLRSDGRSGEAAVVASSGSGESVTLNPPVTIGVSDATRIVLRADPAIASAPDFTSRITATVLDARGNPLRGVPLVFSTTAGQLASAGTILHTDASGTATDRLALGNEQVARVSASSGSVSAAVTVSREGAAGPIIALVTPNRGNPGETLQVVISGTGFESGASVSFGAGTTANVLSVSATEIQVQLEIFADAAPGPRDVTVSNPTTGADTFPRGFTVGEQGPTITGVEPTQGNTGESLTVTIRGTGFASGARVGFGEGITVSVTSVTETAIGARLTISSSAATGSRTVTVTNPDGRSATLPNGFTVANRPPDIVSVQPAQGIAGTTISVTITGSNFQAGIDADFGSNIEATVDDASVTPTSFQVNLVIDVNATLGARNVTVTNPDGQTDTLTNGFTVTLQ